MVWLATTDEMALIAADRMARLARSCVPGGGGKIRCQL